MACDEICNKYDPDRFYKKFKVIEFPMSVVGMRTSLDLDMDINLETVYIKTMCDGQLMKYSESRERSAAHRAFDIAQKDNILNITYKPSTECIAKALKSSDFLNRFIIDLRFIKVDGLRCCDNEEHAEIGRCYISGEYEYCTLSHSPLVVHFGDVNILQSAKRYIRIHNNSSFVAAKLTYNKAPGYDVVPPQFTIQTNSAKRLAITFKPCSLIMVKSLVFNVTNPFQSPNDIDNNDNNFICYTINTDFNVILKYNRKECIIESLHTLLYQQNPCYTYMGKELEKRDKKQEQALKFLKDSNNKHSIKPKITKFVETGICYPDDSTPKFLFGLNNKNKYDFCKRPREQISTFDLFGITLKPFMIDFGQIGLNSLAENTLSITNNTSLLVNIRLFEDSYITYTNENKRNVKLTLEPNSNISVTLTCDASILGVFNGTFKYSIDNKYFLKHPYTLRVDNPVISINEQVLKFGMVTAESYITSVPIRLHNTFNVPVSFEWDEISTEAPFEVFPTKGTVKEYSIKICELSFICKPTKSKTHEISLRSESIISVTLPFEVTLITRKLSIKFLQNLITFKDIPLNLEVVEKVKLENSSREYATFYIVEPILPGITVEPMSGTLRPKMVREFSVAVKIPCVMEFAFDLLVKINNKENLVLIVSGNVVEPKITIQPKLIYMTRIPTNMITFVPITLQNISLIKAFVEVLDTGDENIFDVYISQGNEKQRTLHFYLEGGQSKTVFIKVYDYYRREYEIFMPFRINGMVGPPDHHHNSTELQYYTHNYERQYDHNSKAKVKSINKDIPYCKMIGVITVPWIEFSQDKFEIEYNPSESNSIVFTMTNISKYLLNVTILTSKLAPWFSLDIFTEEIETIVNEHAIKFEFSRCKSVQFTLKFHPKGHGRFVAVAPLFLDRLNATPYYNLTFIGRRQIPVMTCDTYRLIFPPCLVGTELEKDIVLKLEYVSDLEPFTCSSKEDPSVHIKFTDYKIEQEGEKMFTIVRCKVKVCCKTAYAKVLLLGFHHECGSGCDVEVVFSSTYCPLTLHIHRIVQALDDPYPYYPLESQTNLYTYLERCCAFLEKWMFQQGFRRELYPVIPDTFHAISAGISTTTSAVKQNKGMNVSYLNFIKRITGPLMKHIRKILLHGVDDTFKQIKEIHDTYREIINLMRSRGVPLIMLKAKFLLNFDQFVIYTENTSTKSNADIIMIQELRSKPKLFERLNKQCWIDFILQSYKVFVLDSCFFECVCVSTHSRNIVQILIDWYNENISIRQSRLRSKVPLKVITDLNDLCDSIGLISVIENYCPFLQDHFSSMLYPNNVEYESVIIHNTCLVVEALNLLKLYFPLTCKDMSEPNFIQMLFLSIHLYVTLPMFEPKETVTFTPPLLRSTSRLLIISPVSQETLQFSFSTLFNTGNYFNVEKAQSQEAKKMYLTVKYSANLTKKSECFVLIYGYNKTRIFDTYMIFKLVGCFSALTPFKKYKLVGPMYRPVKLEVLVSSPFSVSANYQVSLTDIEPSVTSLNYCDTDNKYNFFVRRLQLVDKEVYLLGMPKEGPTEQTECKVYMQLICLHTQIGNTWVWFRSEIGEFIIKITTQPRWDLALDTLQVKMESWPMNSCNCGESCECYRTTVLMIPHRNELMVKSLRTALLENASVLMMTIFDKLIETITGRVILLTLLTENGTNINEVKHILREQNTYRITSRSLTPRLDTAKLDQHTDTLLALPVTLPAHDKSDRYSVTLTSACGMDIRTYRLVLLPANSTDQSSSMFL